MEQRKKKIFFFLIDGIADTNLKEIGNKTTLQIAKVPTMDLIASSGVNGMMDPVETGLACGSDTAHMSIFGYNPFKFYKGRGSFETLGAGIDLKLGDIAFKSNFGYADLEKNIIVKRRIDRYFDKWGLPLIEAIDGITLNYNGNEYKVHVKHGTEMRAGVKITGPGMCCNVRGTDPLKDDLPIRKAIPRGDGTDVKEITTASVINLAQEKIIQILSNHPINLERVKEGLEPANCLLLRGTGELLDVECFEKKSGFKAFAISPTAIIKGFGISIGLTQIEVPGATGNFETNFENKAKYAMENLISSEKDFDFCFLHVKAVDDAGHDKSIELKIEFLEKVDTMYKEIYDKIKQIDGKDCDYYFCVTGDHTTPVFVGDHSFEPVPFAITSVSQMIQYEKDRACEGLLRDNVEKFDEISNVEGILGRFPGSEVMKIIKGFMY